LLLTSITVYIHTDVKTATSSEETEIEEAIQDQKAEAIATLQDIRQTLERLQTDTIPSQISFWSQQAEKCEQYLFIGFSISTLPNSSLLLANE
jgi:hypothetical protein